jgi:CheY-like chemotaxis protein
VQGKSILVVDDEPQIANVLVRTLSGDGHDVETAADGATALDKLQEHTYDLILSDLRMPTMDGPGLYRAVERHYPGLERRFIFLTGDTLSPEMGAFLEAIQVPCLHKPFNLEEVRQVVQQELRTMQNG